MGQATKVKTNKYNLHILYAGGLNQNLRNQLEMNDVNGEKCMVKGKSE